MAWRPILLGGVFAAVGRRSWATTDARADGIAEIERRAAARGLPPLVWPDPWPNDGLRAMRVATWADREGAGREFALAAMRVQFAAGEPLSHVGALADAVELAGLRATEGLAAAAAPEIKARLRDATDAAIARGVRGVPTVALGDRLVWGDDRLDELAGS